MIIKFWVGSCFEAQCLILRSVFSISNFSFSSRIWENLLEFSEHLLLFPALMALFQLCSVQLHSAEQLFLRGPWLRTLESSWCFGISQRILGHYASYSWSGDLGFLRLMQLFPLIPVLSFNPYFLLPSCGATRADLAMSLLCPGSTYSHGAWFSRGSSWAFPALWWC